MSMDEYLEQEREIFDLTDLTEEDINIILNEVYYE